MGSELLFARDLQEGKQMERVAFLLKVVRKLDVNGDWFLRFYLKTADKSMIIGRKFRVSSDPGIGSEIVEAQRAMVSVNFLVSVFAGSYSLLVDNIRLVSGVDPSNFFDKYGRTEAVLSRLTELGKRFGVGGAWISLSHVVLTEILEGKVGGILSVVDFVLNVLSTFEEEEFFEKLMFVWLKLVDPLVSFLQIRDKAGFVPRRTVFDLIDGVSGFDEKSVFVDTFMALTGVGREEHFVAHIIAGAYRLALYQIELASRIKISPNDSLIEIGSEKIAVY